MDVLKKELEEAFGRQVFKAGEQDEDALRASIADVRSMAGISNGCAVLSDLATGTSRFFIGSFARFLGLEAGDAAREHLDTLDEDCIYRRMHPEDLVDKRMLELAFFNFIYDKPPCDRRDYRSVCRVRMLNHRGEYVYVTNRTQILRNDASGNIWLALCLYDLAVEQTPLSGIDSWIVNNGTGERIPLSFARQRSALLSEREKEILRLIKNGLLSKEIAWRLGISVNTVNRHRQNILRKLSVDNSIEAVQTAYDMRLL